MVDRGKKRTKQKVEAASKTGHHARPDVSVRRGKYKSIMVWTICGILVAIAAWTVLRTDTPKTAESAPMPNASSEKPAKRVEAPANDPVSDALVSGARLTIPETEFDFGYAPQKAKISHDFWLHSSGTNTLEILKVNPG